MLSKTIIATIYVATAAAAPLVPDGRQLPTASRGLGGGLGGALPTGIATVGGGGFSIPTNLGGGIPTGVHGLPTSLPGAEGSEGVEKRQLSLPSGLLGGLGGGLGGSEGGGLSLPTGLLGGGLGSGSGSGESIPIPTSLTGGSDSGLGSLESLGSLGSGSSGSSSGSGSGSGSGLSGLSGLVSLDSSSSSQNNVEEGCKAVTLIFARGTTEVGTMGTVVGPGLASDTESAVGAGKVAVLGVDYPASAQGNVAEVMGSGDGSTAMAADVGAALASCPGTTVVLAGYSQGAMAVHNAMGMLGAAQAACVGAAVTFGDPFVSQMPAGLAEGAFRSFCAAGDALCAAAAGSSPSSGGTGSQSALGHLGYGSDAGAAAEFIKSKVAV